MWINELTEAECEAVLERATIARLATCLDDRPYVVPISIKFERDGAARTSSSDGRDSMPRLGRAWRSPSPS